MAVLQRLVSRQLLKPRHVWKDGIGIRRLRLVTNAMETARLVMDPPPPISRPVRLASFRQLVQTAIVMVHVLAILRNVLVPGLAMPQPATPVITSSRMVLVRPQKAPLAIAIHILSPLVRQANFLIHNAEAVPLVELILFAVRGS